MDLTQIRELLKVVADSGVAEVEIEEEGFRMVVRLTAPTVTLQPQQAAYPMPPMYPYAPPPAYPPAYAPQAAPPPPPPPAPAAPAAPPAPAPPAEAVVNANDFVVKAPIVGTFYRAPGPDAGPFVNVGDRVNPGDVLCIIEAMKLMNEIECDVAGTIKEILVQNAEPVDFEKPLFLIAKD
ncbi:MAG: acetyl-CoA carboxylase biotin carboxyl carrier protein [Rhodothermales bacterium]